MLVVMRDIGITHRKEARVKTLSHLIYESQWGYNNCIVADDLISKNKNLG